MFFKKFNMYLLLWLPIAFSRVLVGTALQSTENQFPLTTPEQVPVSEEFDYGVGFDLTASYG